MALATQPAECYLIWDRLKTTVQTERRWSSSGTWYAGSHTSGSCRFMFMTEACAQSLAAALSDTTRTAAIACANGSFDEFPCAVSRVTFGPDGRSVSVVSKWTVDPVRRSDGMGFDVAVNIDYDTYTEVQ